MVLGAEEAIKSFFLVAVSAGFSVQASSIRKFLLQHKPRHAVAALWVLYSFVLSRWMTEIEALHEDYPEHQGEGYEKARREKVEGLVAELNEIADAEPDESPVIGELVWWGESDELKQSGFYVDFSQDEWRTPESLGEKDFEEAIKAANIALDYARSAVDFFEKVPPDVRAGFLDRLQHVADRFRPKDQE